jgi:hypothetical protein
VREIQLNEVVEEDIERAGSECITRLGFKVPCREFQFTAPAAGTLLATLSWNPDSTGMSLLLTIDEQFTRGALQSPVEARVQVVAGKTYRLTVGVIGDSEWWGPFRLTTSMEP